MKSIFISVAALALLLVFMPKPAIALQDSYSGARVFYNPFPINYQRTLVKVFDGLMPGHSTMKDAVSLYGEPKFVVEETYFYWEWRTRRGTKWVMMSFFQPKGRMLPRHNVCGFDGRATIKWIRAFDSNRMGYSTFVSDMVNFVPYPYQLRFHSQDNRYEMQFYEQGYSMFFNGESERFIFEEYFPHKDLILRGVYFLRIGTGGLLYVERDYLN